MSIVERSDSVLSLCTQVLSIVVWVGGKLCSGRPLLEFYGMTVILYV